MKPVVALAKVRGRAAREVNRANWVAVNRRLVCPARKAVNATVPRPTPRYSKETTANKSQGSGPTMLSMAKPGMLAICTSPNSHRAWAMRRRNISAPPMSVPAVLAHRAASLAVAPISVREKPRSR